MANATLKWSRRGICGIYQGKGKRQKCLFQTVQTSAFLAQATLRAYSVTVCRVGFVFVFPLVWGFGLVGLFSP